MLFGFVKLLFCWLIFKLRIKFPYEVIYLAPADIKACLRFPRICYDLIGNLGFMTNHLLFMFAQNMMLLNSMSLEFQHHIKMTNVAGFKNIEKFVHFTIKKAAK